MLKLLASLGLISFLTWFHPFQHFYQIWTGQTTSPEVICSSWTLHVGVVPRNLGYRNPTTTCDYHTCLDTRQRDFPWREIAVEQLPFLPSMLCFRFWDAPVLFSEPEEIPGIPNSIHWICCILKICSSLTCCREAETAAGVHFSWQWDNPRI